MTAISVEWLPSSVLDQGPVLLSDKQGRQITVLPGLVSLDVQILLNLGCDGWLTTGCLIITSTSWMALCSGRYQTCRIPLGRMVILVVSPPPLIIQPLNVFESKTRVPPFLTAFAQILKCRTCEEDAATVLLGALAFTPMTPMWTQ